MPSPNGLASVRRMATIPDANSHRDKISPGGGRYRNRPAGDEPFGPGLREQNEWSDIASDGAIAMVVNDLPFSLRETVEGTLQYTNVIVALYNDVFVRRKVYT